MLGLGKNCLMLPNTLAYCWKASKLHQKEFYFTGIDIADAM